MSISLRRITLSITLRRITLSITLRRIALTVTLISIHKFHNQHKLPCIFAFSCQRKPIRNFTHLKSLQQIVSSFSYKVIFTSEIFIIQFDIELAFASRYGKSELICPSWIFSCIFSSMSFVCLPSDCQYDIRVHFSEIFSVIFQLCTNWFDSQLTLMHIITLN